jgi:transposase
VASLVKKMQRGRPYYYLVYSARVGGKPRIVRQIYLGSPDQVAARLSDQVEPHQAPPDSHAIIREFGASTALWDLVQKLGVVEIINSVVGTHRTELSVGQYLAMAAVNRCISPASKVGFKDWYADSYLSTLLPARTKALESQRFWDAMNQLEEQHILKIEEKLLVRVKQIFDLDVQRVMYDATNFFTYINTQTDATLPQRGHNKAKRDDLRQVSLALLASVDFGVPLFHHCYAGQINDSREFAYALDPMMERLSKLTEIVEVTMVFDKGNNSESNFKRLDQAELHYVGSLSPSQHSDLLDVPLGRFVDLKGGRLAGVTAYRTAKKVFGKQRTVVVTWNPRLAAKQEMALLTYLKKKSAKLKEIQERLERLPSQPKAAQVRTTVATVNREVEALLKQNEVKQCMNYTVTTENGLPCLQFSIRPEAVSQLKARLYGRNLIVTDQDTWSSEDIVLAYRHQYKLEHQFRTMKDPHTFCWWPLLHRTDQKIRVHAFYCVLGLLLVSLLQRELHRAGIEVPIPRMLKELRGIRETTHVLSGEQPESFRCNTTLSKMGPDQRRMYNALGLDRFLLDGPVLGNTWTKRRKSLGTTV